MKEFDIVMKFHDREYDCEAEMKLEECKDSPFSYETRRMLEEFEKNVGEVESVTVVFKKKK